MMDFCVKTANAMILLNSFNAFHMITHAPFWRLTRSDVEIKYFSGM